MKHECQVGQLSAKNCEGGCSGNELGRQAEDVVVGLEERCERHQSTRVRVSDRSAFQRASQGLVVPRLNTCSLIM